MAADAARVDVVNVLDEDRRYLEAFGFRVISESDGLLLGRHPTVQEPDQSSE